MDDDFDKPLEVKTVTELAEEEPLSFKDAATFKAIVEQHKAEGWSNLGMDKKAFICMYIRDGYTTSRMVDRGCTVDEAESYLRDPLVQAAIADVSEQYAVINTFSASGWRAKLARALDMAFGDTPQLFSIKAPNGEQLPAVPIRKADMAAVAKLLEMAAKYRDIKDPPKEVEFERFPSLPWERRA